MNVKAFFDPNTFTVTYVAWDPSTRDAVIIDPVLDLDTSTWRTATTSADEVVQFVRGESLTVRWVLDTHAHADHLTGMAWLKETFGAPTAIGEHITAVQSLFAGAFNLADFPTDGRQWDELLTDGQQLNAGSLTIETLHTPGHTPACVSYRIGDSVFTGDTLFQPDYGTGRCDFPKGSSTDLYRSITGRLFTLPDRTRVFTGHDYMPNGREPQWESTIGEQKASNVHLSASTSESDFVAFRTARDKSLAPPKLILPSLQVNIDAGRLPTPEANGRSYFKIPVNFLGS